MSNKDKIIPYQFDHDRAVENGRKGGIMKGVNAQKRRTLADTLRAALEQDAGGGMTKQEYLVAKCLQTLGKEKVFPKDLKTLAEVLGELRINVDHSGDALIKVVRDEEEAEKLANIGELNG